MRILPPNRSVPHALHVPTASGRHGFRIVERGERRWKSGAAARSPPAKGPEEWFTGTVRIDPLFSRPEPARVGGALVTFEPGARTAWHTHPLGQTLIVTAGCGWVQREGGPVEEIRPGDVVWFAPGEKHWHGAAPTRRMTPHRHRRRSSTARPSTGWRHVTDAQYRRLTLPPRTQE